MKHKVEVVITVTAYRGILIKQLLRKAKIMLLQLEDPILIDIESINQS